MSVWPSWRDLRMPEFWAVLALTIGGVGQAPLWIIGGGVVALMLLGASRQWRALYRRAAELDMQWRELAAVAWVQGKHALAIGLWLRGQWRTWVIATHISYNAAFCALAYGLGRAIAWLWGLA